MIIGIIDTQASGLRFDDQAPMINLASVKAVF